MSIKTRQYQNGNTEEEKKDMKLLAAIKNTKPKSVHHGMNDILQKMHAIRSNAHFSPLI